MKLLYLLLPLLLLGITYSANPTLLSTSNGMAIYNITFNKTSSVGIYTFKLMTIRNITETAVSQECSITNKIRCKVQFIMEPSNWTAILIYNNGIAYNSQELKETLRIIPPKAVIRYNFYHQHQNLLKYILLLLGITLIAGNILYYKFNKQNIYKGIKGEKKYGL